LLDLAADFLRKIIQCGACAGAVSRILGEKSHRVGVCGAVVADFI